MNLVPVGKHKYRFLSNASPDYDESIIAPTLRQAKRILAKRYKTTVAYVDREYGVDTVY